MAKRRLVWLLSKRYAGTPLSYSRLSGSFLGDGYYWTTVSGVFDLPETLLIRDGFCYKTVSGLITPDAPAQVLTQYLHYKAIEAMFLAEPGELAECSERFEWIHPIAIGPFVQAHPLD